MKKLKITSLAIVAALLSVAAGVLWNNYPLESSPLGSETLLVGNSTTNHRWLISDMYILTRSNANRGMQSGSANLTNWSALDPSSKEDASANLDLWSLLNPSTKQNASGNLDLWAAVVPSSYQTILGYTPATTNFGTLSVPGLAFPDGVTIVIDPTTHKWSSVATGTGDFVGPAGATSGHIVTFGSGTGKLGADSGHALSEYALAGITNGWPWQALNQPLTANGTAWSLLATSAKQDASANLSLWSSFTPVNYTNNLYSLFQPALGFTPMTFQQVTQAVLSLTVPLDMLSTNGQVSIFGIDSNTNPVPIHLRNNLSFSANGVGGYDLDASGSGGTASAKPATNIWPANTNIVIIDPLKSSSWSVGLITNSYLRISNSFALTNLPIEIPLWVHQDTNGTWRLLGFDVVGGLLKTNMSTTFALSTNASAENLVKLSLDWTGTNIYASLVGTNIGPKTASTNSLATGGGGGGGGTAFTVVSTANQAGTSGTTTTAAISTTGANGIAICVSGAGTPTDSSGNTWTLESSGAACNWFFCASPTVSGSHTFSIASAQNIIVVAFTKAGGTPSFDQETHAGTTGNWGAVSMQPGAITPGAADSILLTGAWWDVNITSSTIAVNSSFNLVGTGLWNGSGGTHAAYKILSSASSQNPTWSESFGSNPDGKCGMISIK